MNEGDGGAQARDGTCLFRKIGHTQIRNDTFPEQASSVSGLGAPRLLRSPPPLVRAPVCVRPPHLRSPSFPHRQGVPKVSWPHHFRDPNMLTPPLRRPPHSRARPLCAPPCFPALSPLHANGCAGGTVRPPSPFRLGYATPAPSLRALPRPSLPACPPPLCACRGAQEGQRSHPQSPPPGIRQPRAPPPGLRALPHCYDSDTVTLLFPYL